jgi:hypothetical protein
LLPEIELPGESENSKASAANTAAYISAILGGLRESAERAQLGDLAYLLSMAQAEAKDQENRAEKLPEAAPLKAPRS